MRGCGRSSCVCNGIVCTKGEFVIIEKGTPVACVKDYRHVIDIFEYKKVFEEAENCVIFTGLGLNNFDSQQYEQLLKDKFGEIDVSFLDGKQRIYDLIIGVI